MKTWLRKLRGVISIGAIWGLVSSLLGLGIGAIESWIYHDVLTTTVVNHLIVKALVVSVEGFVIGSGFAAVLTIMDGRKTLDQLTPLRAALWGGLTGGVMITVLGLVSSGQGNDFTLAQIVINACMGITVPAGLAAGTVSLARLAPAELGAAAKLDDSRLLADSGEPRTHQFGPVWRKEQPGPTAP